MATNPTTANATSAQGIASALPIPIARPTTTVHSLRRRNKRIGLAISYAILIVMTVFAVYPVYFALLVSVSKTGQLVPTNLADMFLPTSGISFDSYAAVVKMDVNAGHAYIYWLGNSLFVAITTSIASVLICTSAAFALSRIRFRGRNGVLILFLAIQAFPGILALGAITTLLTNVGLYRNLVGLILAYSAGSIVFSTWNLKGYFDTIPIDIEEAALIDGCSVLQSFFRVLLPLSLPAIGVTAFFGFLAGWGEYVLASALIPSPTTLQTLPVALYNLAGSKNVPWGQFAAASALVAIPTMVMFLIMQRYLQSGLTAGGVKG